MNNTIPYSFLDDYSEGCHPNILNALNQTNMQQQTAYGEDDYCREAKACIHKHMIGLTPEIHFIASGTLTNLIVIASCLRPHEAVIAPASGHITLRETGAIEATGHKIIAMPGENGKLRPEDVEQALAENAHFPHMAKPRMVYISNASELGSAEVSRIRTTADTGTSSINPLRMRLHRWLSCKENTLAKTPRTNTVAAPINRSGTKLRLIRVVSNCKPQKRLPALTSCE